MFAQQPEVQNKLYQLFLLGIFILTPSSGGTKRCSDCGWLPVNALCMSQSMNSSSLNVQFDNPNYLVLYFVRIMCKLI